MAPEATSLRPALGERFGPAQEIGWWSTVACAFSSATDAAVGPVSPLRTT